MKISEFKLISKIKNQIKPISDKVVCGIGDDCAVIELDKKKYQLLTTDCLVENIHFIKNQVKPDQLGFKSLSVNVSDIAAMGGKPETALVTLAFPKQTSEKWIHQFYEGLNEALKFYHVDLVGGDTSASADSIFINICLTGVVKKKYCLLRSGAKVGDAIFVSGQPGLSALGFYLIQNNQKQFPDLIAKHQKPVAQLDLSRQLVKTGFLSSMIDLSDGLSGDLNHILTQSDVGVLLIENQLPQNSVFKKVCEKFKLNKIDLILNGGEDYELLFTIKKNYFSDFLAHNKKQNWPITCIGEITSKNQGILIHNSKGFKEVLKAQSYDHFD